MYDIFKKDARTDLDDEIDVIHDKMRVRGPDSDEYPKLMSYLERLHAIKAQRRPNRVSRDNMAIIAGNLVGILLIIAYEQKHIINQKGFSQIIRPNLPN